MIILTAIEDDQGLNSITKEYKGESIIGYYASYGGLATDHCYSLVRDESGNYGIAKWRIEEDKIAEALKEDAVEWIGDDYHEADDKIVHHLHEDAMGIQELINSLAGSNDLLLVEKLD